MIVPEGVSAEIFICNIKRRSFESWEEAPDPPIAELDLPRIKSVRQLPARARARRWNPSQRKPKR